jgi:hypothetical protein
LDAGSVFVACFFKGLQIDKQGNRLIVHGLLTLLMPMALHAQGLVGVGALIRVNIGITMAVQTLPLFAIHYRWHHGRIVCPRFRGDQGKTDET